MSWSSEENMIYLVTITDKHTDPEYIAFTHLKDAEKYVDKELAEYMESYRLDLGHLYSLDLQGKEDWYASHSSDCGSFQITIKGIHVDDHNRRTNMVVG